MIIGILKEIKTEENRGGRTSAGVEVLVGNGHRVLVENSAGVGSDFSDGDKRGKKGNKNSGSESY